MGSASPLRISGRVKRRKAPATQSRPRGHALIVAAVALGVASGLFLGGYNSLAGMASAYLVMMAGVLALGISGPPDAAFWRDLRLPALCFGFALLWLLAIHAGLPALLGGPLSLTPDHFLPRLFGLLAGALALTAGAMLARDAADARFALEVLLHATAASLLLGLLLWLLDMGGPELTGLLTWRGRFAGLIGNANTSAAIGGALLLVNLALLAERLTPGRGRPRRSRKARRIALALCAGEMAIGLGTIILAASRAILVLTLLLALFIIARGMLAMKLRQALLALGGMLGSVLLLALLFLFNGQIGQRFATLDREWEARIAMWRHFADLASASPLFGYGLGSFTSLRTLDPGPERLAESIWNVNSAHNILLQLLLHGGLPYLAAMAAAIGLLGWRGWRGWRSGGAPRPPGVAGLPRRGVICALGLILAGSLVDIALDVPAAILFFLFLLGLLAGGGSLSPPGDAAPTRG